MLFYPYALVLLLVISWSYADITATTDDGKKVLLQDDGKWHYLNEEESTAPPPDKKRLTLVELFKNDKQYDFRKVRWGMGKKEVIASENGKIIKNKGDSLEYEMQLFGYDCSVLYAFKKDALDRAYFMINQPHVDPALFYKDYNELKKFLVPLYGKAVSDKCDWKNEIYRNDTTKWGFAVSIGFLTCSSEWHSDRTRILLSISGGNHQILTNVEYTAFK
jgi:hypothetical protein